MGKFALSLHPEKTRLIEFRRFAARNRKERPDDYNGIHHTQPRLPHEQLPPGAVAVDRDPAARADARPNEPRRGEGAYK
jgi:hypothetical protein